MTRPGSASKRVAWRLVLFAVLVGLLYAGLRSHPVPEAFHEEDKLYHLLGFAALAACTRLAFPRRAWWWQTLAMLAIGAGIELAQALMPGRVGSVWDFAFDTLGIAIGLALSRWPTLRRLGGP